MFDPARAQLRVLLASGKTVGVLWLSLGAPVIAELAAAARPDAIVLDLQHGLWERGTLEAAIGLVPAEIPVIVRVAENSALAIGSALDAGAEAVMVPLIETAEEATRAVAYATYPPNGIRSGGGVRPLRDFPAYVAGATKLVTIVMIETARGLANAVQIAAVPGVDMVFIGTGDLALSLGVFPQGGPAHGKACADILAACQAAGTLCGIFTFDASAAQARTAEGYRLVVTANDIDLVARGFAGATQSFVGTD
jgi:2-keto-3-deoxy-L-rhamnonate aldolase RhmA